MARKTVFIATEDNFSEEEFEYIFSPGFALVQKQKNIISLNDSIHKKYPKYKILEVSSKSDNPLGVSLSAFNLELNNLSVESIFQSSKVFYDGTQFAFLLNSTPREAKKYVKENSPGPLKCFRYEGVEYPLFPKSAFYDYIYIKALIDNKELSDQLRQYDAFTDVEFNSKKSINCQARTCSIYSFLLKSGKINEYASSFEQFVEVYKNSKNISLSI